MCAHRASSAWTENAVPGRRTTAAGSIILAIGGSFTGARSVKNRDGAMLHIGQVQPLESECPLTAEVAGAASLSMQQPLDTDTFAAWHMSPAVSTHLASSAGKLPEQAAMHASKLAEPTAGTISAASTSQVVSFVRRERMPEFLKRYYTLFRRPTEPLNLQ